MYVKSNKWFNTLIVFTRGRVGYANEDRGPGKWWVEGDMWFRQWERWYFGEALGFYVVQDGASIKLFEANDLLSDIGVLHTPSENLQDHLD